MSKLFYSFTSGGFFDEEIHGSQLMEIVKPGWERPVVDVTLQPGDAYGEGADRVLNETEHAIIIKNAPDLSVPLETVLVPNPACKIPDDAIEIPHELRVELLAGQSAGGKIVEGQDGLPMLQMPTLEERQAEVWSKIKQERDRRNTDGGYQVGGHWFHSDTFSRTQQLGLVLLGANLPAGVLWKTMSGEKVVMSPALATQVFAAAAASDIAVFAAAEAHKAAMMAASEPESYDFADGWPQTFQG